MQLGHLTGVAAERARPTLLAVAWEETSGNRVRPLAPIPDM